MSASGSRDSSPELTHAMGAVARELFGNPTEDKPGRNELRFRTRGSLAIDTRAGTFFDHEIGEGGGVLALVQRERQTDKEGALNWLADRGYIEKTNGKATIVATYDYTDASGELLFQVVRFDPKDFRQRRPDGAGGWIWKMQGVERVLYRLQGVLEAISAGEQIFIVEGEKSADRLAEAGITATCSPGGANKWHPEYAQWLERAHLTILPDNDDPGRLHAGSVARSLTGHAASIRVLELPGLAHKADAFDWLAAGNTSDQLLDLAEVAPLWTEIEPTEKAEQPEQSTGLKLELIDPRTLAGVPIPVRQWIIPDWLPFGHVTINYADGGTGKTLLAQQLLTSCATGAYWLGLTPHRCKVFGLFCEDDADEVHRRQDRINDALGLDWPDLGDMRWACAVGSDSVLVRFEPDGSWKTTPRFAEIIKAARDFGAQLIVIDTAADCFGGNENDRQQVRAFLGPVLTKLARDIGGAVLLNAHPSRSGMSASGDVDGGSTAWSNTARSRWSLTRPPAEEGAEPDVNARILTRRKANYSSIGETIPLRWHDSVLVPQNVAAASSGAPARAAAESLFLTLLDRCLEQGQAVSDSSHAANFAPKIFAKRPDRRGLTRKDFDVAMQALFASRSIRLGEYGRAGKWRSRIERDPQDDGGEA